MIYERGSKSLFVLWQFNPKYNGEDPFQSLPSLAKATINNPFVVILYLLSRKVSFSLFGFALIQIPLLGDTAPLIKVAHLLVEGGCP